MALFFDEKVLSLVLPLNYCSQSFPLCSSQFCFYFLSLSFSSLLRLLFPDLGEDTQRCARLAGAHHHFCLGYISSVRYIFCLLQLYPLSLFFSCFLTDTFPSTTLPKPFLVHFCIERCALSRWKETTQANKEDVGEYGAVEHSRKSMLRLRHATTRHSVTHQRECFAGLSPRKRERKTRLAVKVVHRIKTHFSCSVLLKRLLIFVHRNYLILEISESFFKMDVVYFGQKDLFPGEDLIWLLGKKIEAINIERILNILRGYCKDIEHIKNNTKHIAMIYLYGTWFNWRCDQCLLSDQLDEHKHNLI